MQVKETFGLYKCCNGHDLCYATCGTSKGFCEKVVNQKPRRP
jgi:secretory phospholipase A2